MSEAERGRLRPRPEKEDTCCSLADRMKLRPDTVPITSTAFFFEFNERSEKLSGPERDRSCASEILRITSYS